MKLCIIHILFLNLTLSVYAMSFNIENQEHYSINRIKQEKDHVIIDIPLKECGLCYEDKHLTGSVPCEEGDKHPEICDECMHMLQESDHVSKGTCPFCRRALLKSKDLSCSICKEKLKSTQQSTDVGCCACFVAAYKTIRSLFTYVLTLFE